MSETTEVVGAAEVTLGIGEIYRIDRSSDERLKEMRCIERFYEGRQHDHHAFDWWGDPIGARHPSYMRLREMWAMKNPNGARAERLMVSRRPCAQMGTAQQINSAFTTMTIPTMPSVEVAGDEDATDCANEMLRAADAAVKLADLRGMAGRVGSAALIVEIVAGQPRLTPRRSADIYVLRWADIGSWTPADVVYQREVMVDEAPRGRVKQVCKLRTTRYTETHVIEYEDVDEDANEDKPIPVASIRLHGAGRCPVIWHQNLSCDSSPEGPHDLERDANLELCDRIDQLSSTIMVATAVNTEPTVVKKERAGLPGIYNRVQKGAGKVIHVSEAGDAKYLEISGTTIDVAWKTLTRFEEKVQRNVACVLPESESMGQKTATEIERSWSAMALKVEMFRSSMTRTIKAAAGMFLSMARSLGVSSPDDPDPEKVILPPIIDIEDEEDVLEDAAEGDPEAMAAAAMPEIEPIVVVKLRDPGKGRSISVKWPAIRSVPPSALPGVLSGLFSATKGQQILSRKTATAEVCSALGRIDVEEELDRIEDEEEDRQAKAVEAFGANSVAFAAEGAAAASDPGEEGDQGGDEEVMEEGNDNPVGGQPPQKE